MEDKQTLQKKKIPFLIQLVIILLVVMGVRTFVFGTAVVKGSSMEPNFIHGDFVMVNKFAYDFANPTHNDIVVCRLESGKGGESIIKRVIGVPGDEIELRMTNEYDLRYELYINGELSEEPFILEPINQAGDLQYPFTVPENSYFVMGDNRNASTDSRSKTIGAIPKDQFVGKVAFRLYPFSRMGGI